MKFRKEKYEKRDAKKAAKKTVHTQKENASEKKKRSFQFPVSSFQKVQELKKKKRAIGNSLAIGNWQLATDTHPSRKFPTHEVEGTIKITAKGVGYVAVAGMDEDVEIDPAFLATALDNDRVRVRLHPKRASQRQGGEVTALLLRHKTKWVGIVEREDGRYYVVPDDQKMYRDLFIPTDKLNGAKKGDKVFASLHSWTDPKKDPIGQVERVIGLPGEHDVDMELVALERGFDISFP